MGISVLGMTTSQSEVTPWEPPLAGSEEEALLGALDRVRWSFRYKIDDLDADGLNTTVGASALTLGALAKHLAAVEDWMSTVKLEGRGIGEPWSGWGWDGSTDWEFTSAAEDSPAGIYRTYDDAVARARERVGSFLDDGGLDRPIAAAEGRANARRLLLDHLEEYARHLGQADLIREAVDGRVGEDPPDGWRPVCGASRG